MRTTTTLTASDTGSTSYPPECVFGLDTWCDSYMCPNLAELQAMPVGCGMGDEEGLTAEVCESDKPGGRRLRVDVAYYFGLDQWWYDSSDTLLAFATANDVLQCPETGYFVWYGPYQRCDTWRRITDHCFGDPAGNARFVNALSANVDLNVVVGGETAVTGLAAGASSDAGAMLGASFDNYFQGLGYRALGGTVDVEWVDEGGTVLAIEPLETRPFQGATVLLIGSLSQVSQVTVQESGFAPLSGGHAFTLVHAASETPDLVVRIDGHPPVRLAEGESSDPMVVSVGPILVELDLDSDETYESMYHIEVSDDREASNIYIVIQEPGQVGILHHQRGKNPAVVPAL